MTTPQTIRLHARDNVVVAADDIAAAAPVVAENLTTTTDIPFGHKIAADMIEQGEFVIKFGQIIGQAGKRISPGDHVHSHNMTMPAIDQTFRSVSGGEAGRPLEQTGERDFMGYHRPHGGVGTRNFIGVLATVNCSASVVRFVCAQVERSGLLNAFPNIDGIVPCAHTTGCGMAASGEGIETLRRTLRGYARHPNFGAVLIIGLGCEVNQAGRLFADDKLADNPRLSTLNIQETGGTEETVEAAVARIEAMLPLIGSDTRRPTPASKLVLALQCGGSDGYSGITANPALGVAADLLVAEGGTVILSETPEIFGAEHLLLSRARTPEVGARLLDRLRWWRDYVGRHGGSLDNNPSPGNKAGGLTTILEKSLGATAKGGSTPLNDFISYGEPLTTSGLVFMDSPGYDPCAVTGQVAAGANVIGFTSGRGSVFGCKPVPSLKIASSDRLYARMRDDMDINAGVIASGGASIEEVGNQIFDMILEVASGRKTRSESLNMGDCEFVPWQLGAVV